MLDNTLTFSVDALNNGTPANEVFTRIESYNTRSVYKGPGHSLIARDILAFYKTTPTKSGNFNGTAKSAAKFTIDTEVAGVDSSTSVTLPQIGEISFSLPIGTTAAEAKKLRQRMIAYLDNDALCARHMEQLEV